MRRNANVSASIEDEESFTRFANDIGLQALRVAMRWTNNRQAAEDIVQETFIRTWQSRGRITDDAKAWFFKILWNVFLTHQKRHPSKREVELESHFKEWNADGNYSIVDDQDEIEGLLTAVSELDRHLLSMRYGEDFTFKDIAHITGIPMGTLKSRIHRALKEIRKCLPSEQTVESNGNPPLTTGGKPPWTENGASR